MPWKQLLRWSDFVLLGEMKNRCEICHVGSDALCGVHSPKVIVTSPCNGIKAERKGSQWAEKRGHGVETGNSLGLAEKAPHRPLALLSDSQQSLLTSLGVHLYPAGLGSSCIWHWGALAAQRRRSPGTERDEAGEGLCQLRAAGRDNLPSVRSVSPRCCRLH